MHPSGPYPLGGPPHTALRIVPSAYRPRAALHVRDLPPLYSINTIELIINPPGPALRAATVPPRRPMAVASTTSVEAHPLTGRIGAVIVGVDLAGPLSDDTVADVRQALLAHRVVFFRGQHLDAPGQIAFASRLG